MGTFASSVLRRCTIGRESSPGRLSLRCLTFLRLCRVLSCNNIAATILMMTTHCFITFGVREEVLIILIAGIINGLHLLFFMLLP